MNQPAIASDPYEQAALLFDVAGSFYDHYARLTPVQRDAVVLWDAAEHARNAKKEILSDTAPILGFLSHQPGSGKSRCLQLTQMICGTRFQPFTEPTAPAVVHVLTKIQEACFLDESDILFGSGSRKERIRGVLNSCYTLYGGGTPYMDHGELQENKCFGFVAFAGLDVVQSATRDKLKPLFTRTIAIHLNMATDAVPPMRPARGHAAQIHSTFERWAANNRVALSAVPDIPDWLANREGEVWGPLINAAATAGPRWLSRAYEVADALTSGCDAPPLATSLPALAQLSATGWRDPAEVARSRAAMYRALRTS